MLILNKHLDRLRGYMSKEVEVETSLMSPRGNLVHNR